MFQAIRNYFSAPACAQRQRDDERAILTAERKTLPQGVYGDARERYIARRLFELDSADLFAMAAPLVERRKGYRLIEPAPAYVEADEVRRDELRLVRR